MASIGAVMMCAGEGKRMKSKLPKVLAQVLFKPMSDWVLEGIRGASIENICLVTGHKSSILEDYYKDAGLSFVYQAQRLGTGHAVMQATEFVKSLKNGTVLVASGDNPFISSKTISAAIAQHTEQKNGVTVITAKVDNPFGYGRIIRGKNGEVVKIVEQKDCMENEKLIGEINSSWYIFSAPVLLKALEKLTNNNAAGEYYLTDAVEILIGEKKRAGAYAAEDANEILGANSREQLLQLNDIARTKVLKKLMEEGISFSDITGVSISPEVVIGTDTVIHKGTIVKGKTVIGDFCEIGPDCVIENSVIGDNVTILQSTIEHSTVGKGTTIGPFAHLRPHSELGVSCHIGNFVEIKNSKIGDKTKCGHLTYVGDTDCGSGVNFGCGVVTANYDGKKKYRTTIGNNAFIGSNTNLVAPVKVGDNATTAAGSTITDDVPAEALAIARARQVNKEEWAKKKKTE